MKRTTIMLPDDLKKKAEQTAYKQGISLGTLIRESLSVYISAKNQHNDTLFEDNAVYGGNVPEDLALNHDEYLYGENE